MSSRITKDFNRRGSGHVAAVRMSVVVLTSLIVLSSLLFAVS
jgi:hypothetical protein